MPVFNPRPLAKALAVATLGLFSLCATAQSETPARRLFVSSAVENTADNTVTLPLHRGITRLGETVWYVVLDASNKEAAERYGVNRSDKLNNAKGTAAVQKVDIVNGLIEFPATVDFTPEHVVEPSQAGFPPDVAQSEP